MIFIKRLTLVDSAEDKMLWEGRAKTQWGIGEPLAVRVSGVDGSALGTTFPQNVLPSSTTNLWSASWVGGEEEGKETEEAEVDVSINATTCLTDGGICAFEVLDMAGHLYSSCLTELKVKDGVEEVTHSIILTPLASPTGEETIYAHLEFTLVRERYYEEKKQAGESFPRPTAVTDSLTGVGLAHECVLFSTNKLFYPSQFVTGSGAYFVSNVITVESTSDHPVDVELLFSGGGEGKQISISPSSISFTQKGERRHFICTHNVFKKYGEDSKLYAIIQEGGENRIPFTIVSSNGFPRMDDGLFLMWVNMNKLGNIVFSDEETGEIKKQLPVFSLSKKN
ncbi:hypothetical protein ADEAN_000807700 [Angomonas deanei]|uniref:Uncharacterized protein n=1 Tax=Angomonas deanei TaxID=59799 RepID=A0A7G2CMA3_9TRYP|nr:hypothetical protein ADEAN_000807700 [Angomonas deanei]